MRVFIRPRGGEYVSIEFHPVCTLRGFGCLSNTAHWTTPDLDFRGKPMQGAEVMSKTKAPRYDPHII